MAGLLAGMAGALAGARLVEGLLFGVAARDTATFLAAPLLLLAVAAVASYVPARRAMRIDPMQALRIE